MFEITKYLDKIINRDCLSSTETSRVFSIIAKNGATPAQIGAILSALQTKGYSAEELAGATIAMQNYMLELSLNDPLRESIIDNCGTGGDKKGTYNISTAASFVIAGAGIPVAKHGNNSVSSKSGSADVLEALGVYLNLAPEQSAECLEKAGICFLYAKLFHPAMRIVAPVRRELGVRTIFNVLGPLLNPAKPKRQIIGVYKKDLIATICKSLQELGHKHAMVVHGDDGLDEISVCGKTFVAELKDDKITEYEINPNDFEIDIHEEDKLKGGDAKTNAQALHAVLSGQNSAYTDAVAINAGAGIYVGGKANNLKDGVKLARKILASGKAKEKLQKLVEITNYFQ